MGIQLSIATVKRTRRKLGWKQCGPKYCQMVRETNHVARLAFAEECIENGESFNDLIFTDESTIWLEQHGKICFRKEGQPAKLKPKSKHPFKVHIWAGISKCGATGVNIHQDHEERILRRGDIAKCASALYSKGIFRWISLSAGQ